MRKMMIVLASMSSQLLAGGFYLQLGNPEAITEARKAGAVLTVKATGCGEPEKAQITATATGVVKGKGRLTIPLKLMPLSEPGMFALTRQWPKEGKWVIEIKGVEKINGNPAHTYALVTAGPDGIDRYHAKSNMKGFSPTEIDAMLN